MKKGLLILTALALLFTGLAGCAKQESAAPAAESSAPSGQKGAADLSEKLDINWMAVSYQGGGWPDDHPMIQELNKKFNINLKIQWVPAANYREKLNVLAASNDFPDIFFIYAPEFNKWKKQGLFLDVQPKLSNYTNLAAIPQDVLQLLNPKGKVLGFPYYITQARDTLSVREDWLKKLNLPAPQTLDEFYETAKAFATRDPDGNGKADTNGFTLYIDSNSALVGVEFIMAGFGLANQWKLDNGKLVPYQTQVEEWKKVLAYLSKAYAEGVLDKDFAVNKIGAPAEKMESGRVGFYYGNPNQYNVSINNLKKVVPEGNIVPIVPPKGPTGLTGTPTFDMTTKHVINAKIDPKKQERILLLMDYFLSPEGSDFIKHGIEGIHYKKLADGKYEKLEAADKDRQNLINNWIFRPFDPGIQMYKWDDASVHQKIRDMFVENEKHKWANPAAGLESDTQNKAGANINAKFMETVSKIIMGREPVDAIEKASKDWLAAGGAKIAEELNQAYAE